MTIRNVMRCAAVSLTLAGGCGDETCPTVDAWSAPAWDANTTEAIALREGLNGLGSTMRDAEQNATAVTAAELSAAYEGTPNLSTATSPAWRSVSGDVFAEFEELSAVGPIDLVDGDGAWAPGEHGGILGTSSRGINEGGLEVRQITDKGLFGGAMLYRYAASQTEGEVDEAAVERIAAAFGASATLGDDDITDSANYANTMGFYDDVSASLTVAHGHAEAPEDCAAERDVALVEAFRTWELAMFARFVFYANAALATIEEEVSNESVASASHALSEGLGLAMGFHGLDAPASGPLAGAARVATDAQIEAMVSALGVSFGDLGASTTGTLLVDPTAYAAGVADAEAAVADAFGLTADEVAAFRTELAGE